MRAARKRTVPLGYRKHSADFEVRPVVFYLERVNHN